MYKKRKKFFITFEGIEGSGKSYQSAKLVKNIKKIGLPVISTIVEITGSPIFLIFFTNFAL